jgi:hypothetical protein
MAQRIPGNNEVTFHGSGNYASDEQKEIARQEKQLSRLGIELSRQTMANWLLNVADPWLNIIYDRMHEQILMRDILHADETTVQVLKESGRNAETKSYMWLYRTGREGAPIILYEYQTTRASKHPDKFLLVSMAICKQMAIMAMAN